MPAWAAALVPAIVLGKRRGLRSPTVLPPYTSTVSNFGWMILDDNTASTGVVTMTSSEGTLANRPKLTVNYAF